MLAAGLLPWGYSRESPYIAHLGAAVDLFHQFVVEIMRGLGIVSGPKDVFCGMSEVPAGKIWGRVGLYPGDAVENLVSEFREAAGDREDIVVCSAYPDGAVGFQFVAAGFKPGAVKLVVFFKAFGLVPGAFVYGDHLSALYAYASVGEMVRRVREDHVKLEFKGIKEFDAVSFQQCESVVGRFVIGDYHGFRLLSKLFEIS